MSPVLDFFVDLISRDLVLQELTLGDTVLDLVVNLKLGNLVVFRHDLVDSVRITFDPANIP